MVARGRAARLPARGAGHRRRAVHPGPAGTAGRAQQAADAAARPVRRPDLGLPRPPQPVATTCANSSRSCPANQFRRMCRAEYLNYLRIREWQDLVGQLRQIVKAHGRHRSATRPPTPTQIHRSLLAGLLSHIGLRDPARRRLPRRARRAVRDLPRLGAVRQAAAVGDGRRAGRDVPAVGAGERGRSSRNGPRSSAPHLVKRTYSEPHWERRRGAVVAIERVTLYGVPLVVGRKVGYAPIDPAAVPGAVHPARPGRGRLGHPAPVLRGPTARWSPRSRTWRTGPAGATSWSTTSRSSPSTTRESRPRWCPRGTSTPGGRRPGTARPELLDLTTDD